VVRMQAFHISGLSGFKSWTPCNKWVEAVVGSRHCSERFLQVSLVFLSQQKSTFLTSNLIVNLRVTDLSVLRLLCIIFYLFS